MAVVRDCISLTWRRVSYFPWKLNCKWLLTWSRRISWIVTNRVNRVGELRRKEALILVNKRWWRKETCRKQEAVFLLLSCCRAERQSVKAAVSWYLVPVTVWRVYCSLQWQCLRKCSVVSTYVISVVTWCLFPHLWGFGENVQPFIPHLRSFNFFFFKVEIISCALIPLFRPGSVHSGSASWGKGYLHSRWKRRGEVCVI